MKSILLTLTIITTMCFVCSCTQKATACFEVQTTNPNVSSAVVFTNCSDFGRGHAIWDFGDGSPELNNPLPTVEHTFADTGTYRVVLRVDRGKSTDEFTREIVVTQ
jgi:PKD repeat protein